METAHHPEHPHRTRRHPVPAGVAGQPPLGTADVGAGGIFPARPLWIGTRLGIHTTYPFHLSAALVSSEGR